MIEAKDFWNLPGNIVTILYLLTAIAMIALFAGFWSKTRIWSMGRDTDNSLKGLGPMSLLRISIAKLFSADCLLARRVFPRSVPRAFLLVGIIWGFILLFLGTVSRTIDHYIFHFLRGQVWLTFSFVLDMAGLFLMIGTVFGLLRRYVWKPERMATSIRDGLFLFWLFFVIFSGYVIEGTRIIVLNSPAADWSPVGYALGKAALWASGGSVEGLKSIHLAFWIAHMLLSLSFIAYIPFSKGFHIFASQITTSLAAQRREEQDKALADLAGKGLER
ncbi:MAG: respiratory nitrate reductase subunit gamma [Nitrospirae bacterium]|nr:respiratory nitrate reductase subunit gamma [Nitrospirota bacterium]